MCHVTYFIIPEDKRFVNRSYRIKVQSNRFFKPEFSLKINAQKSAPPKAAHFFVTLHSSAQFCALNSSARINFAESVFAYCWDFDDNIL